MNNKKYEISKHNIEINIVDISPRDVDILNSMPYFNILSLFSLFLQSDLAKYVDVLPNM